MNKTVTKINTPAWGQFRLGFHLYLRLNKPRPKSPRPNDQLKLYAKYMSKHVKTTDFTQQYITNNEVNRF